MRDHRQRGRDVGAANRRHGRLECNVVATEAAQCCGPLALRLLQEDLAFYYTRAGLDQPSLRLSRAQRRWGSCSGERATGRCIRINWRLVMAPDHVRRSVVAHEVAHLVHFDHSPAFYRMLGQVYDADIAVTIEPLFCAAGRLRRQPPRPPVGRGHQLQRGPRRARVHARARSHAQVRCVCCC